MGFITAFAGDVPKKVKPCDKVYATAKGKKYHCKNCRTLKKSKTLVELTISQAKQKGLNPCKICNPPTKEIMTSGKE